MLMKLPKEIRSRSPKIGFIDDTEMRLPANPEYPISKSFFFLSRIELQRAYREIDNSTTNHPTAIGGIRYNDGSVGKSRWIVQLHDDGRLQIGCQVFSATQTNIILRWLEQCL